MGSATQALHQAVILLTLATALCGAPPPLPPNLPQPPPLPPGLLESKPPEPPPNLPDPAELFAQLKQLDDLLSLSPEKLAKLRQTIEFIEKMPPDEREAMRIRLAQVTRVTPELRAEISQLASLLSPHERSDLSQFWLASSEAERTELRTAMTDLANPEKGALLRAKVQAFVARRDEVFAKMKASLDQKKQAVGKAAPPAP